MSPLDRAPLLPCILDALLAGRDPLRALLERDAVEEDAIRRLTGLSPAAADRTLPSVRSVVRRGCAPRLRRLPIKISAEAFAGYEAFRAQLGAKPTP